MIDPQALQQGDAKARCAAAKSLGARQDDAALGALVEALDGREEVVRDCIVAALRANAAAVPFVVAEATRRDVALVAALKATNRAAVQQATFALGQHLRRAGALSDERLLALVDLGLRANQPRFVRSGAAWCLANQSFSAIAQSRYAAALADEHKDVRWSAADGLVRAARGADAARKAAIVALARPRLVTEADAGVRQKLEAALSAVGAAPAP